MITISLKKIVYTALWATLPIAFCSCSNNDNNIAEINIPSQDDEDCCSLETEEIVLRYEQRLNLVYTATTINNRYTIRVYADDKNFATGYNNIYYSVVKTQSGRHVKDVEFINTTPLMTMKNGIQHSTPVGNATALQSYLPLHQGWVAFSMTGGDMGSWELSLSYRIKDTVGTIENVPIDVVANSNLTIQSFKQDETTYYVTLANPAALKVGTNRVKAYISKFGNDKKQPAQLTTQLFTIEINPTMPDMGGHSSPNNENLTGSGELHGVLNLTMTGLWEIEFTVKDNNGNIVAEKLKWSVNV